MGIPRPKRPMSGSKPRSCIAKTIPASERKPRWMSKAQWEEEQRTEPAYLAGAKPHCLVYVRTYCAKLRWLWDKCLHNTGCEVLETLPIGEPDESGHARLTCYRIMGMPGQLESAVMYGCVQGYEYVTNARVPLGEKLDEAGIPYVLKVTAQGAGPEKVKSNTKPGNPKWSGLKSDDTPDGNQWPYEITDCAEKCSNAALGTV